MLERSPKMQATISKPSDATAYTAGDIVANSLTASAVVPMEFPLQHGFQSGKVLGARIMIKPASGNVVITALDLDLLLFRGAADIPFAAGGFPADNAALTLTDVMYRELIAVIPFVTGAWRNHLGALTAGTVGYQAVRMAQPAGFSISGAARNALIGVLQAKGAWTPGAVAQTLSVDVETELYI